MGRFFCGIDRKNTKKDAPQPEKNPVFALGSEGKSDKRPNYIHLCGLKDPLPGRGDSAFFAEGKIFRIHKVANLRQKTEAANADSGMAA